MGAILRFLMRHLKLIQISLLIILCLGVYASSCKNGFIWDDDDYVYNNSYIQNAEGLKYIWLSRKTPQYYPIIFTMFWLEHKLWGLNPFGYHVVNLIFHIINALLLFLILQKLCPGFAFPVALLFAIHPIQVETVAWITERKNIMALFFFQLALLAYLRFDRVGNIKSYLIVIGFFICALLSKSISVCFVFIPVLYKWFKDNKVNFREIKISLPLIFIGFLAAINTIYMEFYHVGARGVDWSLSLLGRFILSGRIALFYIYKVCFPFKFMFFYPRWSVDVTIWWQWIFSISVISFLIFLFYYRRHIGRAAIVLFSFYIISIFPALGFFNVYPMIYSFVADHFSYLSMPWLLLLICSSTYFIFDKLSNRFLFLKSYLGKISGWLIFSIIIISMCVKSQALTRNYNNIFIFWKDSIAKNPQSWMAYNNLGLAYARAGKDQEAIANYKKSIEINPKYVQAYNNLGLAFGRRGEHKQAIDYYRKALEINPDSAETYNSLGLIYDSLGEFNKARGYYEKSIEIKPNYIYAYNNLGLLYDSLGQQSKAVVVLIKAIKINSNYAEIYNTLGIVNYHQEKYKEAVSNYQRAIEIDFNFADAYYNLGVVYVSLGEHKKAINNFKKSIEIYPSFAKAYYNLGAVFLRIHQYAKAEINLNKARNLFQSQQDYKRAQMASEILNKIP